MTTPQPRCVIKPPKTDIYSEAPHRSLDDNVIETAALVGELSNGIIETFGACAGTWVLGLLASVWRSRYQQAAGGEVVGVGEAVGCAA